MADVPLHQSSRLDTIDGEYLADRLLPGEVKTIEAIEAAQTNVLVANCLYDHHAVHPPKMLSRDD